MKIYDSSSENDQTAVNATIENMIDLYMTSLNKIETESL
jgi:hypothetical protein